MNFYLRLIPAHRATPPIYYYRFGKSFGIYGQIPYTQKCLIFGISFNR